jgi:hypothetical protein
MTVFKRTNFLVKLTYKELPFMSYGPEVGQRLFDKSMVRSMCFKQCFSMLVPIQLPANIFYIDATYFSHSSPPLIKLVCRNNQALSFKASKVSLMCYSKEDGEDTFLIIPSVE